MYRNWHQGRVGEIIRLGLAFVDVLRVGGEDYFSEYCQFPGLRVEVNDVVLFHDHDFTLDLSWEDSKPHICVVYSEEEVDQLKAWVWRYQTVHQSCYREDIMADQFL